MSLSGQQVQQIQEALLDAYSEPSLRQMLRMQMDVNLDYVAGGGNLSEIVFNLIAWAERTGNVDRLIDAAYADNPGNNLLQKLATDGEAGSISPTGKQSAPSGRSGGDTFDVVIGDNVSNVAIGKDIIQNVGDPQTGDSDGSLPGTAVESPAIDDD